MNDLNIYFENIWKTFKYYFNCCNEPYYDFEPNTFYNDEYACFGRSWG